MRDLKGARVPGGSARWLRLRVLLLGAGFIVALLSVLGRAVQLQLVEGERLRELAQDQYIRQIEVPARRGDVTDRTGVALAKTVDVDSIWIDPSFSSDLRAVSRQLAKTLHLDAAELHTRLARAKRFAWVKRQAKPDEVAAVKALGIPGIGLSKEAKRFYPQRELAAQVIGIVGTDGKGLDGIERAFDDELSGQSGQLTGLRDARGRKLLPHGLANPLERQGAAVSLTIDRHIQHVADKALVKAVEESRAIAGSVVVLDPKTGELLALSNYPRFNPNTPEKMPREAGRNRAALDAFEPGSTFKSFVVAGALEDQAIRADQGFFCENGNWDVGRNTIHDTHPYGWLTPAKVLQVSSNICSAKIAQALGRDRLVEYYSRFGFGERTSLALPGEGRGIIPYPKSDIALATASFGQGITATAVQLASAYGALANGGVLMRPILVSKVVDPDGVVLLENRPTEVRQVVSEKTARTVLGMLEGVVTPEGTAPRARLEAFRVAGKTGTAQKADPVARGYSDKRIASFVGVVPVENPRLVILAVIDEPKTDVYGGIVAAPVFREVASEALLYLGAQPSHPQPGVASAAPGASNSSKSLTTRGELEGEGGSKETARVDAVTEQLGDGNVIVPDLSGEVARTAVSRLLAAALEPRLSGMGRVVSQSPPAGTQVSRGARVSLELAGGLPP